VRNTLCVLVNLLPCSELRARENAVAKLNYYQARKQRELARKARQQEKQQRKSARVRVADATSPGEPDGTSTPDTPVAGER
jgi:hypothetical protein